MVESDKRFTGSIPDVYDAWLVPLIFETYAADMARRVAALGPGDVLETAAGSGVVARALAPRLPEGARYVVSDLNPPMLRRGAARQPAGGRLHWQPADALDLPFGDASFDVVCCQFGAMFFPDRVAGHREARRVLRPGGRYIFSVWDEIAANGFADCVTLALEEMFPDDPPRFLARVPHGYHDPDRVRADLAAAGFAEVTLETVGGESRAGAARDPAIAYCQGTPLRSEIEARGPAALAEATDLAEARIAERYGPGPVLAPIRAHVVSAGR
ncbi:class I SAM-dependent methyltransferase [Marinovum sp.]|uniref:class I SAM-dependent methyltransferase n=1 Tax=Marinovum sp. TaxID=2024839 RepID=UPI002B2748FA|nr:methyltransferase domain-containing protein [Marinovum sp.]